MVASVDRCVVQLSLKEDGSVHEVMENLAVSGAKVEIVDTEHGKMLKIVTKNRTTVRGYMSGCAYRVSLRFEIWAKWSGLTLPVHTGYVWSFWTTNHPGER